MTDHTAPAPPAGRNSGIGASEVPAICGLSPWQSPIDTWLRKTGRADEQPDNPAMKMGRRMEAVIADAYAEERNVKLAHSPTFVHPQVPWAFATPDRLAPDRLLEIKNVGSRMSHHWPEGEAPVYVIAQVTWQMLVSQSQLADIAALIGGADFRIVGVPFDKDLADMLMERCEAFWRNHVQADVPPPIDASDSTRAWLLKRWPKNLRPMVEATAEAEKWAGELARVKVELATLEERKALAENALRAEIADAEGLIGQGWSAKWTEAKGQVSYKAVAEELGAPAELLEKHRGAGTRRFTFKTTKE